MAVIKKDTMAWTIMSNWTEILNGVTTMIHCCHHICWKLSQNKIVFLWAAMWPLLGIIKDDGKKKPAQFKLDDYIKGETGECYKRLESYCCKPKSKKWAIVTLRYVLDTACINCRGSPWKSFLSSFDLGWNLTDWSYHL